MIVNEFIIFQMRLILYIEQGQLKSYFNLFTNDQE